MILLDTSGILAASTPDDVNYQSARTALSAARPPLLLSPFVLAELDYMLTRDLGQNAEALFLADVARGAYVLAPFSAQDVEVASTIIQRYADLNIGLADASIVVLAARTGSRDLLTFDRRHFQALRMLDGQPFHLLPEG